MGKKTGPSEPDAVSLSPSDLQHGYRVTPLLPLTHNFDTAGYTIGHGYAGACDGALAPGASYTFAQCKALFNFTGCDLDDGTGCEVD